MLELRLLEDRDIPLIEDWMNKEHVKKWYEIPHMDVKIDDWIYEINQRNGEFNWITYFIAMWEGKPIGFCQYYKCENSDEDYGSLIVEGSYGIDYLIGEEDYIGKGLGKGIVNLLVDKILSLGDGERVTADIDKKNKASENTLFSCGFTLLDSEKSRYVKNKHQE